MANEQIITFDDSAGFLLTPEILRRIGINAGDKFELTIINRTLILRSLDEAERARKIAAATQDIFDRRREAYQILAQVPH
jgi:bifunctional DNA-binding transcriptional regulator/antitoxin component of YhaV-PrlF toxin-antitoxin module